MNYTIIIFPSWRFQVIQCMLQTNMSSLSVYLLKTIPFSIDSVIHGENVSLMRRNLS